VRIGIGSDQIGFSARDQPRSPHEAIRYLVAAKTDGMIAGEIGVNALLKFSVTASCVSASTAVERPAPMISKKLLLRR